MTDLDDTLLVHSDGSGEVADWRQRVKGTNICDASLLATDYLNHFNEVVMLIGMIPDMPECLDDFVEMIEIIGGDQEGKGHLDKNFERPGMADEQPET